MGDHAFTFNYNPDQDCAESVPYQITYNEDTGDLKGFVFQHIANLYSDNDRFEEVNSAAIDGIIDTPPTCLYELADYPGISTMHIYVTNYHSNCL